ncbi:hypothetical protein EYC84_010357 [Monilinia fructicola]|uniref:Amidoligase enzyme n=1 Tax=Monilinia fructicola TaxID=38448 RepID=A0A5M9JHX1_MONFR|nr:hypothetical protein EYC84_010357 [Monilinia fructicola]
MSQNTKAEDLKPKATKSETRLTFGVEVEYLLATVHPVHSDPNPKDPRETDGKKLGTIDATNKEIALKLEAVGIPVSILWYEPGDEPDPTDRSFETDWMLKYDPSVVPAYRIHPNYREFGMEISSPPYYYDDASREAVRTILKVLRNNYLVRVDSSAGLHIHVGNEHDGFQLPVFRSLVAILYTYERQIRLILPAQRVQTSQAKWCRPFSYSRFGSKNPNMTRLEFLNHILSSQDQNQLIADMSSGDGDQRLGFNLLNLMLPYEDSKRTIEFRIHHGTLDPDAILHWLHFCIKLVEKAAYTTDLDRLMTKT